MHGNQAQSGFIKMILGGIWMVFFSKPEAAEAMFRAEGKYPSRVPFMEQTITDIHKMNNWPSPMIFA